jgi:peptidoglycan-associated lipoprotein
MGGTTKYVLGAVVVIAAVIGAFFLFGGDSEPPTDIQETEIIAESTPQPLAEESVEDTSSEFQPPDLDKVYFDFDKYNIRADARQALDANAKWLRDHPDTRVVLEGHCDERGTEEYNIALGDRRAAAVRRQLVQRGVNAGRLETVSYGKSRPVRPNAVTEAEHQLNRRVEFSVTR